MAKHKRRLFETILHITLFYLTLYDVLPSAELATILFAFIIFCHVSERLRWQMAPLFIGYILYWFQYNILSSIFGMASMILCYILPLPKALSPYKGAFEVGYFDYEYYGEKKDNNKKQGCDIAMGRLFYPTLQRRRYNFFTWPSSQAYFFHADTNLLRALLNTFAENISILSNIPFLLDYWALITVPITRFAVPIFSTSATLNSALPVVIFSHGLSASREISTSLCMELASMGFYVFAVEHTDGSCALARFQDGTVIEYDFSKGGNINARKSQTGIRIQNMKRHLELIDKLNSGYFVKADSYNFSQVKIDKASAQMQENLLLKLRNNFDLKKLIFAGHSFGGVTAFSTALEMEVGSNYDNNDDEGVMKTFTPAAVVLLDPANLWMPDYLANKMDTDNNNANNKNKKKLLKNTPVLSIFSSVWYKNNTDDNYQKMIKFSCGKYGNNTNSCVLAIDGSQHLGLCDV